MRCHSRVEHEPPRPVAQVSAGCFAGDVDPPGDGSTARLLPALAQAVELELGNHQHDSHHHLARGRGRVEALCDRDELGPGAVEFPDHLQGAGQAAGEAIELCDHDPFALPRLRSSQRFGEAGTIDVGAGPVEVGVEAGDLHPFEPCPGFDLLALHARADEGAAVASADPTDPDVTVDAHSPLVAFAADKESSRSDAG